MIQLNNPFILIVGGAGYIGSHVNAFLYSKGYRTLVLDDLSQGNQKSVLDGTFIQGSIASRQDLETIFDQYPIKAVMHFAALTDVGQSMIEPAHYYRQNVANTLTLLDVMLHYKVKSFIFSSSAAIFGLPQQARIDESHPQIPINPYGKSKLMIETILKDYDAAYGLKSSCLRYFNAAGGDPGGKLKSYKKKESNLIPLVLKSLISPNEKAITIFGNDYPTFDGTCIRDYIHIEDLASAHVLALEKLFADQTSSFYNLGNGNGFSVREVIDAVERVTGKNVMAIDGPRRPCDPAILVADSKKAQEELGWQARYPLLDTMIAHAWQALQ